MSPDGVVFAPRWWRLTVTVAVGGLVTLFVASAVVDGYIQHPSPAAIVAASLDLVGFAVLLARRRWPTAVLAVEAAVAAAALALSGTSIHSGGIFLTVIAVYTFGTLRPPAHTIVAAAVTAVTIAAVHCLREGGLNPLVPDVALFTATTAVSFYVRSHRALLASYRERAEQAEHEQQWATARAVAAERVRIARDLHDVVAHHVSLLVVQAGAVRETLPADHVTRPVLNSMIEGGRQAMSEMRDMLDALRFDESGRGSGAAATWRAADAVGPPRGPQPTSDLIPALVAGAQAAGLPVTLHVEGDVVAAPPSTSLAAYRIAQEALTNAVKHAPGAFTTVRLDYRPRALLLSIRNGPAPRPPGPGDNAGRGLGIIGMRERVGLAHGTITVGPTEDGWEVCARLPLEPAADPDPLIVPSAW